MECTARWPELHYNVLEHLCKLTVQHACIECPAHSLPKSQQNFLVFVLLGPHFFSLLTTVCFRSVFVVVPHALNLVGV